MKKIEYIKKQDAIDAIVASNRNVDVDGLTAIMKVSPAVVLCKDCIFGKKERGTMVFALAAMWCAEA